MASSAGRRFSPLGWLARLSWPTRFFLLGLLAGFGYTMVTVFGLELRQLSISVCPLENRENQVLRGAPKIQPAEVLKEAPREAMNEALAAPIAARTPPHPKP